ncbi:hypothetical protein Peur_032723 [Populus x canadensis]
MDLDGDGLLFSQGLFVLHSIEAMAGLAGAWSKDLFCFFKIVSNSLIVQLGSLVWQLCLIVQLGSLVWQLCFCVEAFLHARAVLLRLVSLTISACLCRCVFPSSSLNLAF